MLFLAWFSLPAHAQGAVPFRDRGLGEKAALLTGSLVCSAVYTPVKGLYAGAGTIAGGVVVVMSAGQSSAAGAHIVRRSIEGDWFVRPDHLTGNRPLRFSGPSAVDPP